MRTFKNGGDVHDRIHIGLGGEFVAGPYQMFWGEGEKRKLISGVFGPRTTTKGALEARERVHFIGFVRERSFQPGEFSAVTQFVANPHLLKDAAAVKRAIDTWPLQPAHVLNGGDGHRSNRRLPIEPDADWPRMWRVRLPDGRCTDMVNLTRARDAAAVLALAFARRFQAAAA